MHVEQMSQCNFDCSVSCCGAVIFGCLATGFGVLACITIVCPICAVACCFFG